MNYDNCNKDIIIYTSYLCVNDTEWNLKESVGQLSKT